MEEQGSAPVAPAGGKKFPILLVVIVGAAVICLVGAVVGYFVLAKGAEKKFEDAKASVGDIYKGYFEEAVDIADEEEGFELFIEATTDAQKEMSTVLCFAIKEKSDKEDCEDLKTALADAKKTASAAKKILDDGDEEEKEDELDELQGEFMDSILDIMKICDINWY